MESAVCENCIPTLGIAPFSSLHRVGEHHLGVRFGEAARYRATIDGEVRHDVVEVLAGRVGVALIIGDLNKLWDCSNCGRVTRVIHSLRRGRVSVESMRWNAA